MSDAGIWKISPPVQLPSWLVRASTSAVVADVASTSMVIGMVKSQASPTRSATVSWLPMGTTTSWVVPGSARVRGSASGGFAAHTNTPRPTAITSATATSWRDTRWKSIEPACSWLLQAVAAVDLLVPTYRTRARDTVRVGELVTTEVPGLAEALRRPGITIDAELRLTDGAPRDASIVLPDAIGTLALKTLVRSVRNERRDIEDLWRCLEIAAADHVTPSMFDDDRPLGDVRAALWRELGPGGSALPQLTAELQDDAAARMRTRVRALLAEVVGEAP